MHVENWTGNLEMVSNSSVIRRKIYLGLALLLKLLFIYRKNKEDFLRNLARDNTQLLLNAIWKVLYHEIILRSFSVMNLQFCCMYVI